MKSVLLVVFLAAAATAAVVSNEVPDVVELPDVIDRDEVPDVDMNEMPEVVVTVVNELADAADLFAVAEETAVASRRNLTQGHNSTSDVRVYDREHRRNGIAGYVITEDITVRPNNRRITAIRVTTIGGSQNATPYVMSGGIGNSFVTIRIRSAAGRGFRYRVQVWVR